MVLEGSTSEDAFPSEQLPQSDADYYDSPSAASGDPSKLFIGNDANANPVVIDLHALPKPVSLFNTQKLTDNIASAVERSCRVAENVLKRPVTQDEADALAQIYASSIQTASYGSALGVVAGAIFALRGRKDFRFPMWRPMREGSKFSPDRFGPLRGDMARTAWNVSRVSAYLFSGAMLGQIFAGSYAMSTSLRARATEPRLREFNMRLNEVIKKGQMKKVYDDAMADPRPIDREPGPRGAETWEQAQQRRRVQDLSKRYDQSDRGKAVRQPRGGIVDDASPTGGAMQDDFLSDAQVRSQAAESHSMTHDARSAPSSSAAASADKTPTASAGAWDRIRQGAMGGQQSAPRQSPQAAADIARSTQQRIDQDRQDERRRAQEEFDAGLERERNGST